MSQQINLYNPVFRAQKKHFSALAMVQALGLVLAGLLVAYFSALHQTATLERLLADSARESAQRREQLVQLGRQFSDRGTSKKLEEDIARVEAQLRSRNELLGEMRTSVGGNVQGFSPYLRALARQTTQGVWLTGLEIGGASSDLVIRGRALNAELVPAYVRSLSRDPMFSGRSLSSLQVTARESPAPQGAATRSGPSRYLEFTLNIPLSEAAGAPRGSRSAS